MPLDLEDTAHLLGVSPETVRRWARQGRLGVLRDDRGFEVELNELRRWAQGHGLKLREPTRPSTPAAGKLPGETEDLGPPLSAAVARGIVVQDLPSASPADLLRALVEAAPLAEEADREELLRQLLAREELSSTALGGGVALPHPRTPSPAFSPHPLVVVGFPSRPLDWGALDGEPVHAVFLLLNPGPREHLRVLSRLALLLRDPGFLEALRHRPSHEELRVLVAEREPEED